ncbi:MAG: MotA/TolQ/ExbB proton channel family protein [Defluviitaleaceae bacterium]|nr:MotA/TolQ/ExbB proton channel family protein [Defluviitaleaceae bacterium]
MLRLNDLLPPIRDNLLGYDLLIILTAIGTLGYFLFILLYTGKVYSTIYTQGYLPDDVDDEEPVVQTRADLKKMKSRLRNMRETSEKYYTMFVTLTGIFPLMGILGTVISLIPMVQDIQNMQGNFFVALTSTLWGLVFAILFKILDGTLYPRIEGNNRGIDEYLEKLESKLTELKKP